LPVRSVTVLREVVDSVLTYSRSAYPREGILLLRGKSKKGDVRVESVMIPPMATHGEGFSSFSWTLMPIDLTFIGVAHSHPSGYAVPSHQDLLHMMGKIMMIAGYPYSDESCIKIYDSHGEPLSFQVAEKQTQS
jgi:proteasome lid subunit RPN8/RPN11